MSFIFNIVFVGCILIGSAYEFYFKSIKLPTLVVQANGYSGRRVSFWQRRKPGDAPWNKFHFALLIGLPACLFIIYLIAGLLSYLTAWGLTAIKMLVTKPN